VVSLDLVDYLSLVRKNYDVHFWAAGNWINKKGKSVKLLRWLWDHWGWGRNPSHFFYRRINPERQALGDYCKEHGLTRKAAKKGFRKAKMWRKNWAAIRKARYDGWKKGRIK